MFFELKLWKHIHFFFVAIGLSLDLRVLNWSSSFIWVLSGSLMIAAISGKLISPFFLRGEDWNKKLVIGTAMIPRGEVGLIFANVGLTAAVFSDDTYAALILVIALTTLIAPFTLRSLYRSSQSSESCNSLQS